MVIIRKNLHKTETYSHFLKLGIQLNVIRLYIDYSQNDPIVPDPCVTYIENSGLKADINPKK